MTEPSTPLMRQYHSIKTRYPHVLVLFRLGDFYELFYEDAIAASRELQITLTSRNRERGEPVPMCGVPYHAAEGYIARLLRAGYKIAVCDQMEQPGPGKKLVRREVVRVITPGTATSLNVLEPKENNYLAALARAPSGNPVGLAYADITTGEFSVTEFSGADADDKLRDELHRLKPREILLPRQAGLFAGSPGDGDGGGHNPGGRAEIRAALGHLARVRYYEQADVVVLDTVTVRNLELVAPIFAEDAGKGGTPTLLAALDETATGMGARLLRQWILRPQVNREEITARLDAVTELKAHTVLREEIRHGLSGVHDLERLSGRVTLGVASPRDLLGLRQSLTRIPLLRKYLGNCASERLVALHGQIDELSDVRERIESALAEDPPALAEDPPALASDPGVI